MTKKAEQQSLFEDKEWWENDWEGMPEFKCDDKYKGSYSLKIHFRTMEDKLAFAEKIGQPITPKTKSVWHPALKKKEFCHMRYMTDES